MKIKQKQKSKDAPSAASSAPKRSDKTSGRSFRRSRPIPGNKASNTPQNSKFQPGKHKRNDGGRQGQNRQKLVIKVKPTIGQKWFEVDHLKEGPQLETDGPMIEAKPITKDDIQSIEVKATKLLEDDSQAYRQDCLSGAKRADFTWMDGIMKNGTLPDKMAAYIVRVQDSPIHNLNCLQQLISMIKVQGRQQCLMTADTARDLFLEDLLPAGRKLIWFESRGNKLRNATDKELIIWMFEHRLKQQYQNFLEALKKMSTDQVDKMRGKAIVVLSRLLISHPEQEQTVLELLVNKLGDPVKKIASRALFHMNEVVRAHPLMKLIIVREVERLLFRNNIGKKAQYYGICFLNLMNLTHAESQLAVKLVSVCLAFFKACVKTGEIDSKLMGGLLNGVNRAFPIAKMAGMEFSESLDTLYKIVQISQFGIAIQALALLFHVTDIENNAGHADRFYNSLYRKLMDEDLFTTSHNLQLVNLTFKAMKKDNCYSRVVGFTKRLLQVAAGAPSNIACALLYLISEVSKVHKNILVLGTPVKEELKSENEQNDQATENDRQQSAKNIADFEQLVKTTNIVRKDEQVKAKSSRKKSNTTPEPELIEIDTKPEIEIKEETNEELRLTHYDPNVRNPKFCAAEFTYAYELLALAQHAHPSVALFAQTLLNHQRIKYTGNPIKDFTVSRFLARFVFRNAKVNPDRPKYQPAGLRSVPVNSSNYLDAKEEDIPVEERFFYKFFKNRKKASPKKKVKKDDEASDTESIGDDEFDNIMSSYFKEHGPHDEDESSEDEEIDFASEIKKSGKKKKGKKAESEDEMDDNDDEPDEEDDEGHADADEFVEMDSGDEPEYDGDDDDLDNEDDSLPANIFDDDDDDLINYNASASTSGRKSKSKLRGQGTFAPAEQFSEMLEENADMAFSGSHDLINKDNADVKQLKWEMDRDRWVKGHKNKRSFKRKPTSSQNKKGTKRRKFK